jgi:hypothetical protein
MAVAPPNGVQRLSRGVAVGDLGLRGSKVLVFDDFIDTDGGTGSRPTVDVTIVDPTMPGPPQVVATTVATFMVSSDRSTIVYSTDLGTAPGIYVTPLP